MINNLSDEKQMNHHSMKEMQSMSGMSMMTISWSTDCIVYLFDSLHADNTQQFFIGLIVVLLLAIFGQILNIPLVRKFFIGADPGIALDGSQAAILHIYYENNTPTQRAKQEIKDEPSTASQTKQQFLVRKTLYRTRFILFSSFSSLFNLCIMLLAMTMNGYVILVIAIGTGLGKLVVNELSFEGQKVLGNKKDGVDHCV